MSDGFQPEKPYPPGRDSALSLSSLSIALVSALMVMMILALVPRLALESELGWFIVLGGGGLTFVVVYVIARIKEEKS